MVSHPGQILIVDGWCPILVTAPELQEDGMVQLLVMSIKYISQFLNLVLQDILVTAPELQEDGMVQLLVMSIKYISQFLNPVPQGILVMAPELQEDLLGTKVTRYFTYIVYF